MIKVSADSSQILQRNSSKLKSRLTSVVGTLLHQIYQSLLKTVVNKPDIKIWRVSNQKGELHWRVYNPMNEQTGYFNSEAEVRAWLEQRYYE